MANKIMVVLGFLALLSAFTACGRRDEKTAGMEGNPPAFVLPPDPGDAVPERLFTVVPRDIAVKSYFQYLKATVEAWDSLAPYPLSEHLLVRANPWIIDTLENTDYYRRKSLGDTLLRQPNAVVLHKGDTLFFPDSLSALTLLDRMQNTLIDVNIPVYRLRIIEYGKPIYTFPIRVGKNRVRYLELEGHAVDLRTKPGTGTVIRLNRYPTFEDPGSGKKFTHTRRDDKITTLMPQIPWIEVELNGQRYGRTNDEILVSLSEIIGTVKPEKRE